MLTMREADEWLEEHAARLGAARLHVTRSENWPQRAGQGAHFDLEGDNAWGRVTFWPNGVADMAVLDARTGESICWWVGMKFWDADLAEWLEALEEANVS